MMRMLFLGVIFGLLTPTSSEIIPVNSRSCSYAGLFLVEGASRHYLNLSMAADVCKQLGTTLATVEQAQDAFSRGMETCRNGWLSNGSIAILRLTPHSNCANNTTGLILYTHVSDGDLGDAYCFDDQVGPEKNCENAFDLTRRSDTSAELLYSTPETDSGESISTVTPEPGDYGKMFETATTDDVTPTEYGGRGNISFSIGDLDQPTGSGSQPTLAEDETFTTTGFEEDSGETQPIGGGGRDNEETQAPPHPNDKGRVLAPVEPQPDPEKNNDWVVILGVIIAVVAILAVCVLVAKWKSLCGRRQTLMITVKDTGEGNGTAASASSPHSQEREQEMVTLMHKEKIQENGKTEEFTVITLEESPDKDQQA